MGDFQDYLKRQEKLTQDAKRFLEHDREICMITGDKGPYMRPLIIDAPIPLDQVIPEAINLSKCPNGQLKGRGWYINISDQCMNMLLTYLETWAMDCRLRPELPNGPDTKRVLPDYLRDEGKESSAFSNDDLDNSNQDDG